MGKDQRAQAFLGMLDNDPVVGKMVDATSYYELEADEYARKGVVRAPDSPCLSFPGPCRPNGMIASHRIALTHRNRLQCRF